MRLKKLINYIGDIMTQRIKAINEIITNEMEIAASFDGVSPEFVMEGIKNGTIALPHNNKRKKKYYYAIGEGLSTKVNANIGASPYHINLNEELLKMKVAIESGTHSIMDLSLGNKIKTIRKKLLEKCPVMLGTVPLYETAFELSANKRDITDLKINDFLKIIEEQANDGVDFMTIHAGVTKNSIQKFLNQKRQLNIVSRGGSIMTAWIKYNNKESFIYENFDSILDILREYDITISLGDGMRPGAINDSNDRGQIEELLILGELTERAWEKGVQVIVEGPGHIPINRIKTNVEIQKELCNNAPFYVLGPLVNDISAGYDHIAGAIGGTIAAYYGANFLCYVTPSEHLRLPSIDDVREGVISSKIAAFSADLAKGMPYAVNKNTAMSDYRKNLDWNKQIENAIYPPKALKYRNESGIGNDEVCTMCGDFCAIKKLNEII